MDYTKSSAFSPKIIDELNDLAGELDCRLYIFAYYSPKRYEYIADINSRESFWAAVTNLYALYHDCNPFHKNPDIVFSCYNKQEVNSAKNFHDLLSKLRALYCHNCSEIENTNIVYEVCEAFRRCDKNVAFLPDDLDFREANLLFESTQWENALTFLCEFSDEIIRQYKIRLENLKRSPEKQKHVISMLEQIAVWSAESYPGYWRFMVCFADSYRISHKNTSLKVNWQNKDSIDALIRCLKDLLSPDSEEINYTAYPMLLLKEAFPRCGCFSKDNFGKLQIKKLVYPIEQNAN